MTEAFSRPAKTIVMRGLLCILLAMLSACDTVPVAQEINQAQANEIVALLNINGISAIAVRESSGKGKYSVELKSGSYSEAVTLMTRYGLPSERKASFNELTAQSGFLPNSREVEALRLDHAVAIEVEEALQNHAGISSARVVVRRNVLEGRGQPAVSAVIQTRAGQNVAQDEIVSLLQRSVPGVTKENITLVIQEPQAAARIAENEGVFRDKGTVVRVPLVKFLFFRVAEDEFNQLLLILVGAFALIAATALLLGYWYGFYQQSKQYMTPYLPDGEPKMLRLERAKREPPEV